ncbi:hypothetical protein Naga_101843g1 [Nannochloropsis gaditana]|uniref:Uncharacterized protein n=1 Tax=Nannochloropsis gaditana TaxID=72520 RepID=W7TY78_9STRA|nr:hypothetical protein Naga_101843g1 [Nannochloropsis gaditana]
MSGGGRVGGPLFSAGEEATLGSHIGLIALSVFFGYLLNLSLKYLELNRPFLRNHHLVSGIRLFKICMVAAVVCMVTVRAASNLRFKPDWFHRLAGFSLDLMVIAAISSQRFDYYKKVDNLELVIIIILGCVLWNLVAFFAFAKRMFPNFWWGGREGEWEGGRERHRERGGSTDGYMPKREHCYGGI